ncbi:sugar-binding domain-containing protein [Vibrio nigripulchritudo ATCC 27043]|uniref:Transcriptional regulator protein carrying sigma factor-related N-terminal domain n=2 Tax=Vibrio nigripulchritudo TaxID=28173 RepID=A0AAV2VS62_9VIBR|nr:MULTISPECIES: sugar-binding transcriptional regulator [Vibrio]EGU57598.1 sugar-binding domain-containing protein [Vibrio nigripulchritudo ATCC 27043]UAB73187.1 sugar-binding transcriptional regulator [Vibrio sp. SCSIO 43132]CCN83990.1 putative transcriptional regulator protein carrying sigma factor-related N-terminal domain [Vibrio nigripulchritudo BLFn1]CCN89340.1 putative transcriptional regulator protein carrying sigma factor-related N-terminal domain [Vibrio nigripulchritudo SFn27]CCN93
MASVSNIKSVQAKREADWLVRKVLILHYLENKSQADISKYLSLSAAKVNRIIRSAREDGLVEINLNIEHADVAEYERQLVEKTNLLDATLSASVSTDPSVNFKFVAETAAELLLNRLRDGDVICVSGGKAISTLVEVIKPTRSYKVTVVPATGGVQGKYFTDVNHLAYSLAEKLGGKSYQLHAPLFADTREDRDVLMGMQTCKEVLDLARNADIALVGVGALATGSESYFDLRRNMSEEECAQIRANLCEGEMLAHLINVKGASCMDRLNEKLVGLTLEELRNVPMRIGIAASESKVVPILAALNGNFINTLISDENTAKQVLEHMI